MKISRRSFLASASASAANLCFSLKPARAALRREPEAEPDCIVLDLQSQCALRESLAGYQHASDAAQIVTADSFTFSPGRCRLAILPALGAMHSRTLRLVFTLLESGAQVLLESGAAFLSPAEFAAHQRALRDCFDLTIEAPVNLWPQRSADAIADPPSYRPLGRAAQTPGAIPYVQYDWPADAWVRDFSRVLPLSRISGKSAEVIGRVGKFVVAAKKQVGNGMLTFLGSPLGPALRGGDPDARRWLRSLHGAARFNATLPLTQSAWPRNAPHPI